MAEQKLKVTDGNNTWIVTSSEYEAMEAGRPASAPKLTVQGEADVDAVYESATGELIREGISPEQLAMRARVGQAAAATPERIEAHRQQEVRRTTEAIADESDLTTLVNTALPGAQYLQNLAVGEDVAAQARQQLNTNMLASLTGNLAEFAVGGKAISMGFKGLLGAERAAKLGTKLGFGAEASGLSRAGRVAAGDAAVSTHFYTQNIIDRQDGEFVAEDWASQVGVGLLLAAPFMGGAMARGVAASGRRAFDKVAGDIPGAMSAAGDMLTTSNIINPVGMKGRYASALHVSGRVMRKVMSKRKGRGLGATDELAAAQAQRLKNMDHVGGLTPERLDRMAPGKRRAYLEKFAELADGSVKHLNEIEYGTILKRTGQMGRKVGQIRTQMLGIHRRFRGDGPKVSMTKSAQATAISEANVLLKYAEEAGMADVKGAIQRAIVDGGGNPQAMHRAFMDAKINARFRRGVSGGADVVDDSLNRFLSDETIWGAVGARRNKTVLAAIDDTVAVWDELGDVNIPKHLEDIDVNDALHLNRSQTAVARIRDNMNVMEREGLLSADQVRAIETKLVDADDAIVKGTRAYGDAIKINRSRKEAAMRFDNEAAAAAAPTPTSPESFAAQKMAMVGETAQRLAELGTKGLDALLATESQVALAQGVAALHGLSVAEKYEMFHEAQTELPQLTGNPQYAIERIGETLEHGAAYDPAGADQAGAKMVNTLYWLASQMPKPDDTIYGRQAPQPLSLVEEYIEKHVAAYDPVSVGFAAIQGRITQGMVDAVRVTAPAMYAEMNTIFAEMLAQTPAKKANPKVVSGIGLFMGGLDPMYTGNFIMQLQSSYAQTSTQDGVIQGGVGNIPNARAGTPAGNASMTTSQRQQN